MDKGQKILVKEIIRHPSYNVINSDNDIAILKVAGHFRKPWKVGKYSWGLRVHTRGPPFTRFSLTHITQLKILAYGLESKFFIMSAEFDKIFQIEAMITLITKLALLFS